MAAVIAPTSVPSRRRTARANGIENCFVTRAMRGVPIINDCERKGRLNVWTIAGRDRRASFGADRDPVTQPVDDGDIPAKPAVELFFLDQVRRGAQATLGIISGEKPKNIIDEVDRRRNVAPVRTRKLRRTQNGVGVGALVERIDLSSSGEPRCGDQKRGNGQGTPAALRREPCPERIDGPKCHYSNIDCPGRLLKGDPEERRNRLPVTFGGCGIEDRDVTDGSAMLGRGGLL